MIGLGQYMTVGAILFGIGMYGIVSKRNVLAVLMSLELLLNAVNINFIAISKYSAPDSGVAQIFALLVIVVAAAEVAVGLALIIAIYKQKKSLNIDDFNLLKW